MSLEPIVKFLHTKREASLIAELLDTMAKYAFFFDEYDDLSKCAFKAKDYVRAIKFGELALCNALKNEQMWVARSNLINVYNHANYPEKALRLIRANQAVIPDDQDTRLEEAFSYFLMAERDRAEAILRSELERPDLSDEIRGKISFNLGTYELYRGEFQEGLKHFLIDGQRIGLWKKPKLDGELWDGVITPGLKLLVIADAGIGDEIISVRFMKHLTERGVDATWYTDRVDLANIFRESGFNVITDLKQRPWGTKYTYSMALPVYLKLKPDDLWAGQYLKTTAAGDNAWHLPIQCTRPRIGLRWQGNPEYDQDLHRSVPLARIMSALPPLDVWLYSFQRDTGLDELVSSVMDLSPRLKTFEDTMSGLNLMDLVITSCTSIAHASAALGKPTLILIPISAYYTWSHPTKQSPWYGSNVVLFRQVKPRSWDEPIAELKEYLKRYKF